MVVLKCTSYLAIDDPPTLAVTAATVDEAWLEIVRRTVPRNYLSWQLVLDMPINHTLEKLRFPALRGIASES